MNEETDEESCSEPPCLPLSIPLLSKRPILATIREGTMSDSFPSLIGILKKVMRDEKVLQEGVQGQVRDVQKAGRGR